MKKSLILCLLLCLYIYFSDYLHTESLLYYSIIIHVPNSTDAQKRYFVLNKEKEISPEWLLGFTEAEGTFAVDISDAADMKQGKKVQLSFVITQHILDEKLLSDINVQFFDSKGYIENSRDAGSKVKRLRIRDFTTILKVVIPFFDNNIFYSRKKLDYLDWRTIAFMMEKKEHLTQSGLKTIMEIEQKMNRGRTEDGLEKKIARRLSKKNKKNSIETTL